MALPTDPKMAWPPLEHAGQYQNYRRHAAWYEGDPVGLADAYSLTSNSGASAKPGTAERFRSFFWGKGPQPITRTKLHIPIAADIATASADLLFADPPTFTFADETKTDERFKVIADSSGLTNTLLEAAELASPFGGVYLRACWDKDAADTPWTEAIPADRAIPEWMYGRLKAVTFWQQVASDGDTVWRHLERHSPGQIEHRLYKGDSSTIGRPVSLEDHPVTAALAMAVDEDGVVATGIPWLTAAYVPNMRPNRRDRLSPLGRSDYDGIEGPMDALDETWTSWMRDIRLGVGRIIVSAELLRSMGKGQGATFDLDQEIFTPLPGSKPGEVAITPSQFAIRVTEHRDTAAALTERIVSTAGYSGRTFGLRDEGGAATATEVSSSDRKSLVTRTKKTRYWIPSIADMARTLLAIDSFVYATPGVVPVRPMVIFPDGVEEQPRTVAETLNLLHQAEAVSTATSVAMLHPDWPPDQVAEEVAAIGRQNGTAVPDPMGLGQVV